MLYKLNLPANESNVLVYKNVYIGEASSGTKILLNLILIVSI